MADPVDRIIISNRLRTERKLWQQNGVGKAFPTYAVLYLYTDSDLAAEHFYVKKAIPLRWNNENITDVATSTTSITIASTGDKSFTIESGKGFTVGMRVRVYSKVDPTMYIEGAVKSYTSTTLVVTADASSGTGTFTSWVVITIPFNRWKGNWLNNQGQTLYISHIVVHGTTSVGSPDITTLETTVTDEVAPPETEEATRLYTIVKGVPVEVLAEQSVDDYEKAIYS